VPVGTKENGGQRSQKGAQHMAIYHCSIKIISRGKGKSAVAAAAYRSGENLTNEYDGITHDYTRKGGVVHTEILLPDHAPAAYADRSVLWNAVEKIEKAKNAQLAREIEIALPHELTREQGISLVREYVKEQFVSAGMCADIAIHDKNDGNPHAHVMLTIRPIEQDGAWGAKQKKEYILDRDGNKIYDPKKRSYKCRSIPATDWNEQTKAEEWRGAWAEICNQVLEQNGHTERIDHRSYARQGIDQIPTVHLGVAAFQMEKRGIRTERGNLNREIEVTNRRLRQLKARISKLQSWLKEEAANTEPPTLADVIQGVLLKREQTGK
jgi:ATP-dependent exoDNAse (exonuclease V) alpha subunit